MDVLKRVSTERYGPLKWVWDASTVLLKSCWMKKSKIISGSLQIEQPYILWV
jgi:hypothetical protein